MSMCYWSIEGIGVNANALIEYIDKKKVIDHLLFEFSDNKEIVTNLTNISIQGSPYNDFNIDDYMYGEPYDNIADLFCSFETTSFLTYGDNNCGSYYLYYSRRFPWEQSSEEPQTIEEVHNILIETIKKFTTLSTSEIDELIDDNLFDYGCG